MTNLKRKIRKIKFDFSHSVFLALYEHNYYKRRDMGDFSLSNKYFYVINAVRRALREFSEYGKWIGKYNKIRKIEKETNTWYNYLIKKK